MAFDPRVNPNLPSSVKIIDAPPGFSREELDHIIKQAFPVESTASTPSPPRNFDDFTSFSKIVDQTYTRLSETAMPELGGDSDDADDGFRTSLINGTLVFFVAIMFILPNGVVFLVRLREERRIPKLFRRRYLLSAALVWTAYFALFEPRHSLSVRLRADMHPIGFPRSRPFSTMTSKGLHSHRYWPPCSSRSATSPRSSF